jgi:iron-sulfur cluster assembly accessory protein
MSGRSQSAAIETGGTMAQTTETTETTETTDHSTQRMIQLSETAAGEVQKLITDEGRPDIALRIAVQPGGCSGLRYAMYLDDQVSEKDLLEEQFGVKVVVDKMSVPYLTQATIDWVDSLEASGFTIDNPAAQSSCACGHSFH